MREGGAAIGKGQRNMVLSLPWIRL